MAISDVNRRLNCVKNNICALRLILEGYNLGQKWMNNIEIWLRKIAEKENWMARKRLQKKLKILKQNKRRIEQEKKEKERQRVFNAKLRCHKKVVYNNSGEHITKEEEDLLSLGLNFNIAPTRFPIMEYMASTESFCQELENNKGMESKEKAQRIRNIMVKHLRKGCQMKLKSNLDKKE